MFSLLWPKNECSRKKNYTGKINFEIFDLKYVLKHSESIPTKKILPNFLTLAFFSLFWAFWPKNDRVRGKKFTWKNFRFRDFRLRIRFEPFWFDSDQKNWPKYFDFVIFHYFGQFALKRQSPREKLLHRKKFSISRFSV